MAKNVGEGPTLIQLLVGLALQSIMLERVEDWIARPDSPNLYWALTTLPQPLIDPRIGFQGESLFLEAMVPNLAKLRNGPLPKDDAPRIIQGVLKDLGRLGGELNPEPNESKATLGQLGFAGYVVWQYPAAKQELIERGRPAKQVDDMAGSQVVFLNSLERFFEIRDAQWKWIGVPYYQARPGLRESETMYKKSREKYSTDLFFSVFSLVLPASDHVLFSVARQERRMAALRTIEAVRMHAATHGGTPPHQLADVKIVPVPNDPVTGKPFGYELKDRTVILTAAPPEGEAPSVNTALRYELLFR